MFEHIWNEVHWSEREGGGRRRRGSWVKTCQCQLQSHSRVCQSLWSLWWNNSSPICFQRSSSRLQFGLAVTLSAALINNMLTLCRKRLDFIFSNSWEVRRRWEQLSRSQLTVTLPALTQRGQLPSAAPQIFNPHWENISATNMEVLVFKQTSCVCFLSSVNNRNFSNYMQSAANITNYRSSALHHVTSPKMLKMRSYLSFSMKWKVSFHTKCPLFFLI